MRTLREPTHLMSVIFWEQGFSDGVILYDAQLWFFVLFCFYASQTTKLLVDNSSFM